MAAIWRAMRWSRSARLRITRSLIGSRRSVERLHPEYAEDAIKTARPDLPARLLRKRVDSVLGHDYCGGAPLQQVMSVNVIDLRGQGGHTGGASVLADPSGRRHRLLTGIGRIVASALVVWLCGLVVAGLGLLPAPIVPFVSFVGPQSSPSRLDRLPVSRPPSGTGLQPAALASRPVSGTHASDAPSAARVLIGHRHALGGRSRDSYRPVSPKTARSGFDGSTAKPTLVSTRNTPVQSVAGASVESGAAGPPGAAPVPSGTTGTGIAGSSGKSERSGMAGKSGSGPGQGSETRTVPTTTSPSLRGASGSATGHTEAHSYEKTTPGPKG